MRKHTQMLVDCAWLSERLEDPRVRVIEVSSDVNGTAYHQAHIPGASFWFWKDRLWHASDREFATPSEMALHLGNLGISRESTIVLYGDPVQYGTYALWVLTMSGFKNVRLLDGGRTRWVLEGRFMTKEIPAFKSIHNLAGPAEISSRVGREDLLSKLGAPGRILLDVRSIEEYQGERVSPPGGFDHGAERLGRVPGAIHLFYRDLLNEDDTFISKEQLKEKFSNKGLISNSVDEVVTYCRLSHRATLAWFAMTQLVGLENVKIYDGSWTEWGSIVGFPVERDVK